MQTMTSGYFFYKISLHIMFQGSSVSYHGFLVRLDHCSSPKATMNLPQAVAQVRVRSSVGLKRDI